MGETTIAFLSQKNENLTELIKALSASTESTVKTYGFQEKSEFINFIDSNSSAKRIQFLILDVNNSAPETIDFISRVNTHSPTSLKLIFSDSTTLIQVQKILKGQDSMYYLNRNWTESDFILSLNSANACYSNLQILLNHKSPISAFSKKLEDQLGAQLKELNESNMAKDKFFSIVAHDLKSPFTALLGISEILITDWEEITDKEKLDLVKGLKLSTENTYKLLENLLIWSKTQLQKLKAEPEKIRIFDLLDFAIATDKNNAAQKQIQLVNKMDKNIVGFADKNMISTVFRNLLSNATRYTQPGGKIQITNKTYSDFFEICISDNGEGISDQTILNHFNRGQNNPNADLGRIKGLGLLLCKDFIQQNGGEIWLETKPGKGSSFYFTIPRYK